MPAVRVLHARWVVFRCTLSAVYRARKQAHKRSVKQRYRPAQSCVRAGGLTRKIRCLFWCLFGVYEAMRSIPTVSTIQNRDKRFYLLSLFCSILPGNTKQLPAVFGCNPFNLCGTYALDLRNSLSHAMHIQRGITAAAKRLGCHIG